MGGALDIPYLTEVAALPRDDHPLSRVAVGNRSELSLGRTRRFGCHAVEMRIERAIEPVAGEPFLQHVVDPEHQLSKSGFR